MKAANRVSAYLAIIMAMALVTGAFPGRAQQATARPAMQRIVASGELGPSAVPMQSGTVIREIEDLYLGDRWLLVRNPEHPGGPGRLVLAQEKVPSARPGAPAADHLLASPIIHAGDRITLEEHTSQVDAVLEAVALGPAIPGGIFRVRLQVGGQVVRAIATRAGHALLAPETEKQP
jgi:hypothetical protein